jgi:hypothetical protein
MSRDDKVQMLGSQRGCGELYVEQMRDDCNERKDMRGNEKDLRQRPVVVNVVVEGENGRKKKTKENNYINTRLVTPITERVRDNELSPCLWCQSCTALKIQIGTTRFMTY